MTVTIDGTAGITTPAVSTSGTNDAVVQTEGGVAMPRMTLLTAQNTTGGTFVDFTGIPSWAKRLTVMFSGVSTNGTTSPMIQLGAGSIQTTGYDSSAMIAAGGGMATASSTAGLVLSQNTAAALLMSGQMVITLFGSNKWVASSCCSLTASEACFGGGQVTLSGTLDRVRLTTVNGTDLFDAGSVNLLIEG